MALPEILLPESSAQTDPFHTPPSAPISPHLKWICLLALILLAFFFNKPFHIDDPLYVWTARQIQSKPLDFHGFALNWQGYTQPVSQFFENPPLTSYLLAAVACFTGFSEIAFHAAFAFFNILSIVGMYLLSRHFCRRPLLAAILLLFCPAFLISATTVMCEPLLICFWIWAVYLWIAASDRPSLFLLSGVVILAGVLTKFMAICIVPLVILHAVCHRASVKIRWVQALALTIPITGAITYQLLTAHYYGIGGFSGAIHFITASHQTVAAPLIIKLLNTSCFVGGCAAACTAMLPLIFPRWLSAVLVFLILLSALIAALNFLVPVGWSSPPLPGEHSGATTLWAGLAFYSQQMFWIISGSAIIALSIFPLIHKQDLKTDLFLLAWLMGIFLFTACINWSINARSVLPLLPPACLVVVRALDHVPTLAKFKTRLLLTCSFLLTITVTRSDYNLASTIKSAAVTIPPLARSLSPDNRPLWFVGHWGFQYYIEQSGAKPLDAVTPQFQPNDIVIYPASPYGGIPGGSGYDFLRRIEIGPNRWVSATQTQMGAGFYCSYGYALPFIFGPVPPEAFDILRITPRTRIHP